MQKFFDRKEACDIMQATIQQINSGGSNAIWIEGRSGVGKTRLLEYIFDQEPELNFFTFIADVVRLVVLLSTSLRLFLNCNIETLDSLSGIFKATLTAFSIFPF